MVFSALVAEPNCPPFHRAGMSALNSELKGIVRNPVQFQSLFISNMMLDLAQSPLGNLKG